MQAPADPSATYRDPMPSPLPVTRRQERAARDARITTAYLAGTPIDQIAADHDLSPERVNQIIAARPDLVDERRRRDRAATRAEHRKLRARAVAWSRTNPGTPLVDGAAALGITQATLRNILGPRTHLHTHQRSRPVVYDDAQVEAALRAFVGGGGRTRADYNAVHVERGWPSSSVLMARYGPWSAVIGAGLGVSVAKRAGGRRPFSDDVLASWVSLYLSQGNGPWTLHGLGCWLAGQEGAPSVTTIRQRWRTWERIQTEGVVRG